MRIVVAALFLLIIASPLTAAPSPARDPAVGRWPL